MCGYECCISSKSMHLFVLSDQSCNAQNRRSVEIENCLFETYKIYVMPNGKHTFQISSDMSTATICAYPSSNYVLPHWKCVLGCCVICPQINIPSPE